MVTSSQLTRRRHRRSPLIADRRSEIGDRRSEIADRSASAPVLGAPSGPPSRYFSLFLSDSLSVSLSLYLTEMKKWNEIFANRRSVIRDRRSLCLCSGAAVLVAPSGSPALPQCFSLSLSLSLSLFISLNEKMKWNLWTSLSLYSLIAYLISVSLSLFWTVSLLLADFCFFLVFVFLNLALSYPFLLVSMLVLVKYWLSFSVTCVVICDWHCEIFWLQLAI